MAPENSEKESSNREHKSSAFIALFSDPKNAALLYQALESGEKVSPEDIDYTTLSGVLFMARKNDLAFTVKKRVLVISEHQSTVNANMPLRDIIYLGRTFEKLIESRFLYRTSLIPIPTPEFYVFYNGNVPYPREKILRLSDAFLEKSDPPMVELIVKIININLSEMHQLLQDCRPMYEYSWFINQIKERLRRGERRDESIINAMKDAEKNGILIEFLREHGTEVSNMLFTQFNMEDALEVRGEEKFAEGEAVGKIESIIEFLNTLGELPESLEKRIKSEHDLQVLSRWFTTAVTTKSIEEFAKHI